jgi:hypothetical protein
MATTPHHESAGERDRRGKAGQRPGTTTGGKAGSRENAEEDRERERGQRRKRAWPAGEGAGASQWRGGMLRGGFMSPYAGGLGLVRRLRVEPVEGVGEEPDCRDHCSCSSARASWSLRRFAHCFDAMTSSRAAAWTVTDPMMNSVGRGSRSS